MNIFINSLKQNSFSGIPLAEHEIFLLKNFSVRRQPRLPSFRSRNTLNEFC